MNILVKPGVDAAVIGFHYYLYQYRIFNWAGPLQRWINPPGWKPDSADKLDSDRKPEVA